VRRVATGLHTVCEFEGLEAAADGRLLLPCKVSRRARRSPRLIVLAWSPLHGPDQETPALDVSFETLGRPMHPSAIALSPSGTLVLLFGREHAIGEFALDGSVRALWSLDPQRHPQPEGLAITPDGLLLIADEAPSRHGHGMLTVYAQFR
jgi:hypothetical protein